LRAAEDWSKQVSSSVNLLAIIYLVIHTGLLLKARTGERKLASLLLVNLVLSSFFLTLIYGGHWIVGSLPGGRALFLWAPIVFFWYAYLWAGQTFTAFHEPGFSYDTQLLSLDGKWFGQPSLWWARNRSRWLGELMQFFYSTYYFYTPLLGLYLHLQDRIHEFQSMSFAVLFGYMVSYTFFAITPAKGPRWALVEKGLLPASQQRPPGYGLTRLVEKIMYGVAHKGGAMPSAHSSTAVVFLVWCWRIWGWEGGCPALVVVVGMWLGAVYGRYHYLTDILVGGLLGVVALILADTLV
jgi:membrane-associated phospholipid phosphatase